MKTNLKKYLSGIISSALVLGVVGFGSTIAQADDFGVIDLNCDAANIGSFSTVIVPTGGVGDTFQIRNIGSAHNCVIVESSVLGNDDGGLEIVAPGATSSEEFPLTINSSGSFTVQSSAAGNPTTTVVVNACPLDGLGTNSDPWQVDNADDLDRVGESWQEFDLSYNYSCNPSGSYLQTANISAFELGDSSRVDGTFTGTYDGDHYRITYYSGGGLATYEERPPLFEILGVGGVIKRLSLDGHIKSDSTINASLVGRMGGGLISEVRSSVLIEVQDSDAVIGGLVAETIDIGDKRIQYSSFTGSIDWEDNSTDAEGPTIGGLIGIVKDDGVTNIRDSYSRASISYNSGSLQGTDPDVAIYAGGLIGSDGDNELSDTFDSDNGGREHSVGQVSILRSYFAGSFSNTCLGTDSECRTNAPSHVITGGLIGVSSDLDNEGDLIASTFWLSSSASSAVGEIVDGNGQPNIYSGGATSLPEAPGLSAGFLTNLSTYQSEEGNGGEPSGISDLLLAISNGATLAEQDYRWAIEAGSVGTFVPSSYVDESDFLTRALFTDTTVEKEYRVRGAGDLFVHGGADSETVTGYPSLGRVWEICANENNGFPVLVWEERTCSGGGSAAGGNPGGLTDAEYAEFLRSGLTLEQFLARRLAATGAPAEALGQGLVVAALLAAAGLGLILGRRRLKSVNAR